MDFEDFFFDGYGWVTITAVCVLTGIVFGFIFWVWWAMLIIVGAVLLLGGGIAIVLYKKAGSYQTEEEGDEEVTEVKTNFRCPNCGGYIIKGEAHRKKRYHCPYCNTVFTLKELQRGEATTSGQEIKDKSAVTDLSDFEEEYFDACYRLMLRPYNEHSKRQLERRYEQLQNRLIDVDKLYEDTDRDDDELLDEAYEFLSEEKEAIEAYLNEEQEEVIKARYEYFLENYISGEEDEEEDDDI